MYHFPWNPLDVLVLFRRNWLCNLRDSRKRSLGNIRHDFTVACQIENCTIVRFWYVCSVWGNSDLNPVATFIVSLFSKQYSLNYEWKSFVLQFSLCMISNRFLLTCLMFSKVTAVLNPSEDAAVRASIRKIPHLWRHLFTVSSSGASEYVFHTES